MNAHPRGNARHHLGEGLHWDAATGTLWMTDIHGQRLWWSGDEGERWQSAQLPQRVGWVLPLAGSSWLVVGLQSGMAAMPAPQHHGMVEMADLQWLARPFVHRTDLRLNDAKADATGAVWAGSMNNDDPLRSDGCLYRLAPDGSLTVADTGYQVANGPAIRPDKRLMLHTDSGRRTIYAFDLDAETGRLSGKRVWKTFDATEGYPDGMTFDAEGCVWVAHWGAACISRFTLDGRLIARASLPASHVTNVCFGGGAMDRLFVSTARVGLTADQLAREPQAGALFEVTGHQTMGLPGLPCAASAFRRISQGVRAK